METSVWILGCVAVLVLLGMLLRSQDGRDSNHSRPTQQMPMEVYDAGSRSASRQRIRRRVGTFSFPSVDRPSAANVQAEEDGEKVLSYMQNKESYKQAESAACGCKREKMGKQKDQDPNAEELPKQEMHQCLPQETAREQKIKDEEAANDLFEKWKECFSVGSEGTSHKDKEEREEFLNDFAQYIRMHKCVAVKDLAAEFNLQTTECINRIISLEQMGRISGLTHDTGKYIYVSPQEMKAVADYIRRLGRVSIAHLAAKSNEFIDMELIPLPVANPVMPSCAAPIPVA